MTNPKWLIGIAIAFILLTLLCGTLEGSYLGGDVPTMLENLIRIPIPPTLTWFQSAWSMLWFEYSMFHGDWLIFKYLLQCISLGLVVSYGALLIPQLLTAMRSLLSVFAGGRI